MSEKEKNAKLKVLELTLGKLENLGKGVVMKLGDKIAEDIDVIPTDLLIGSSFRSWRLSKGRVIEIWARIIR